MLKKTLNSGLFFIQSFLFFKFPKQIFLIKYLRNKKCEIWTHPLSRTATNVANRCFACQQIQNRRNLNFLFRVPEIAPKSPTELHLRLHSMNWCRNYHQSCWTNDRNRPGKWTRIKKLRKVPDIHRRRTWAHFCCNKKYNKIQFSKTYHWLG